MENLKNFIPPVFKKVNRYHIVGLIVVVLIASAVLRVLTPPTAQKELVIQTDKVQQSQPAISFSDWEVDIPANLGVYQITTVSRSVDRYAIQLAQSLGYKQLGENLWTDEAKQSAISVEPVEQIVLFKNFHSPDELEAITTTVDQQGAQDVFTEFLQTRAQLTGFVIVETKSVLVSNEAIEDAEDQSANAFQFTASQVINDIPFIVGTRRSPMASGIILKNGTILDIRFFPESRTFQELFSQKSLSLNQIKENVSNGLVSYILVVADSTLTGGSDKDLKEIEFTSASVEYRENENNGYVLPYLHLKGLGKDSKNLEYFVEAISPLVKVE